jgi:hypothetical protein
MSNTNGLPGNLIKKMRNVFFDVSPEGILVYMDPIIGQLANNAKQLMVKLNPDKNQFELHLNSQIQQVFKLDKRVGHTCQEAFMAYFNTFSNLCGDKKADLVAA